MFKLNSDSFRTLKGKLWNKIHTEGSANPNPNFIDLNNNTFQKRSEASMR